MEAAEKTMDEEETFDIKRAYRMAVQSLRWEVSDRDGFVSANDPLVFRKVFDAHKDLESISEANYKEGPASISCDIVRMVGEVALGQLHDVEMLLRARYQVTAYVEAAISDLEDIAGLRYEGFMRDGSLTWGRMKQLEGLRDQDIAHANGYFGNGIVFMDEVENGELAINMYVGTRYFGNAQESAEFAKKLEQASRVQWDLQLMYGGFPCDEGGIRYRHSDK